MPSLSRDTDITKFGGGKCAKINFKLAHSFFNIRNSNHKHTCVEHIPNINFVFYLVKSDALPILQEGPYTLEAFHSANIADVFPNVQV